LTIAKKSKLKALVETVWVEQNNSGDFWQLWYSWQLPKNLIVNAGFAEPELRE
jgi:hypothetical protein